MTKKTDINRPSVLYISYDGMTDPLGQSQVLPYLIGLSDDYKIHLLSCEKDKNYKENSQIIDDICTQNGIVWHPLKYHKFPPVISTVYDYRKLLSKAKKLHEINGFEIVHCRSYISSLVGLSMKRRYGVKFIFDMRGFWADERVEGNIWNLSNPIFKLIYRYFKRLEKAYLTESSYVISLTEMAAEEIRNWKINSSPIEVIPTCVDINLFDYKNINPTELEKLKSELGINDNSPIISYLGSVGTWYLTNEMLSSFKAIKYKYKKAKFLFITRDDRNFILDKAKNIGLDEEDFIFLSGNRNEMPLFLALSDINLFYIKPSFSKKASAPTKLGEVMAMGIPIIANRNVGDMDKIVTNDIGYLINTNNPKEIQNVHLQINRLLKLNKKKIRDKSKELFSLENGVAAYKVVYQGILKNVEKE